MKLLPTAYMPSFWAGLNVADMACNSPRSLGSITEDCFEPLHLEQEGIGHPNCLEAIDTLQKLRMSVVHNSNLQLMRVKEHTTCNNMVANSLWLLFRAYFRHLLCV